MTNILKLLKKFKNGATEQDIKKEFPNTTQQELVQELNSMLSSKLIEIINENGTLRYKITAKQELSDEEIIYNVIKESKSKGIWIRDIKIKTNMPQTLIAKVLKNLEHKLQIKSVKSVKSNRKVYVLFEQVLDDEVTGGIWFNEGDVDEEFVSEMSKVIYTFLCKKTNGKLPPINELPSNNDILRFINESKITSVVLNNNDLKILLDLMIADETVQEINNNNNIYYRPLAK